MEKNFEKTAEKKVKFEKPVFYAQNAGEGSFAAGCGAMNRGNSAPTTSFCANRCLNCERTL